MGMGTGTGGGIARGIKSVISKGRGGGKDESV